MKTLAFLVPAVLLSAGSAHADTAAMLQCRTLGDAAARLACYDAIALPGIGSRAGWGAPVATAPAPSRAPAATAGGGGFGLPAAAPEADRVASRIVGRVEDFPNGLRLPLENGQVWQLTESAVGFYRLDNPAVTIQRGVFSGFVMNIEGVNAPLKVRRIK